MPALKINICGIVQGVGFRPFTVLAAGRHNILGTVANKGSYVEIFAKGKQSDIDGFLDEFRENPPERAMILSMNCVLCEDFSAEDFRIIESEREYGDIFVSPDIATCPKCRKELFDPADRRYLHPFINCTQCGPRLTILNSMPYDRERTSMGEFPMCEECEREYTSPETRRFDAQPVCCNDCGPEVFILGTDIKGGEAIKLARREIMSGKIVAVKGIGGFHLCCDAKNPEAVKRLRELKKRPAKPFAVMMKDLHTVRRECEITPAQEKLADGWQKPIILLKKRKNTNLCFEVSPDNPTVGVMLPYAPVQMLLFGYPDGLEMTDCLVMTSGNVSGAPICRDDEDARKEISDYCDLILSHNRKILLRADDTVTDWIFGKPYMIRRSRGYAPLSVTVSGFEGRNALAIGGELKNTFCLVKNGLLYPSPYVGDMSDIRTVNALRQSVERMCELLEVSPEYVVCDMHPRYNTAAVAEEFAEKWNIPLKKVQHHYAHILSCLAENNYHGKAIGVSFDGTGYGTDGTIWGGEFLVCDYCGFKRVGSIEPFKQAGGDMSSKEGWRIAVQLLYSIFGDKAEDYCVWLDLCGRQDFKVQQAMADRNINCVKSTSCGRLFDGVSAILGIRRFSTFEGEASMALQFAAEEYEQSYPEISESYMKCEDPINISEDFFTLATNNIAGYTASVYKNPVNRTKEIQGRLAYEFHAVLADVITAGCEKIRSDSGLDVCALSGGVFQNRLLLRLAKERLENAGFKVLLHSLIPPNDGGICLGQAIAIHNSQFT
ncbi:MAG: carbamoyltransferase HypF, partial [Ruminococcus sp.]|nr:carbamoyltransferase HypF [Ruminococcus sp.]